MHKVPCLDAGISQPRTRPSPPNSNVSLPISPSPSPSVLDITAINLSAAACVWPIEHNEDGTEVEENKDIVKNGHLYVLYALGLFFLYSLECSYCREGAHEMIDPNLAIAQLPSPRRIDPVVAVKQAPPIPPRVGGSKRKFIDYQDASANSIDPARKVSELPCVLYITVNHLRR